MLDIEIVQYVESLAWTRQDDKAQLKSLSNNFSIDRAQTYLEKLCENRPEHCGSGQDALLMACEKTVKKKMCKIHVDTIMTEFCEKKPKSTACKNFNGPESATSPPKDEATTKGMMNLMVIGGIVGIVAVIVIGIGIYFFFCRTSDPPRPPPMQPVAVTPNNQTVNKKKKKKKKKHHKKTSATSEKDSKGPEPPKQPKPDSKAPETSENAPKPDPKALEASENAPKPDPRAPEAPEKVPDSAEPPIVPTPSGNLPEAPEKVHDATTKTPEAPTTPNGAQSVLTLSDGPAKTPEAPEPPETNTPALKIPEDIV
ncbi:hypothetical protein B9Z55_003187 [Caenorhabditis nigoni]|uniref:Uncharacterized protein n=1 Tax=Caenorhabditis nigoni TaxID=1611254 RepID=A0A2G5VNX2_9PELO|nr:hypothetical protein B9Z55_003187 [Caenorhabditis nigoni]